MELFESRRKKIFRGLLLLFPVFLLIFACILFVAGVSHTSGQALVKEQDALEQALKNSAVRSYAMTGEYPEDLAQLLNDYHITYDKNRFIVEYIPNGSNLLPSISIRNSAKTLNRRSEKREDMEWPVFFFSFMKKRLLLFSVFALFLMLMLLFSARVYQQTVKQTDSDSGLGTAITYLTTKFRQHDQADGIFSGSLDDIPALCFRDTLKGKDYITYIYLKDGNLTELFTVADSQASASAGTSISQLSDFQAENLDNGFYRISLKSATGISAHFLLHSTAESSVTGTDAGKKEAS